MPNLHTLMALHLPLRMLLRLWTLLQGLWPWTIGLLPIIPLLPPPPHLLCQWNLVLLQENYCLCFINNG